MKKLLVSGFAALCLAAGSSAGAEEVEFRVQYGDLDLVKPSDLTELRQRVRLAAGKACRGEAGSVAALDQTVYRQCKKEAVAQAEAQIQRHKNLALALASQGSS